MSVKKKRYSAIAEDPYNSAFFESDLTQLRYKTILQMCHPQYRSVFPKPFLKELTRCCRTRVLARNKVWYAQRLCGYHFICPFCIRAYAEFQARRFMQRVKTETQFISKHFPGWEPDTIHVVCALVTDPKASCQVSFKNQLKLNEFDREITWPLYVDNNPKRWRRHRRPNRVGDCLGQFAVGMHITRKAGGFSIHNHVLMPLQGSSFMQAEDRFNDFRDHVLKEDQTNTLDVETGRNVLADVQSSKGKLATFCVEMDDLDKRVNDSQLGAKAAYNFEYTSPRQYLKRADGDIERAAKLYAGDLAALAKYKGALRLKRVYQRLDHYEGRIQLGLKPGASVKFPLATAKIDRHGNATIRGN